MPSDIPSHSRQRLIQSVKEAVFYLLVGTLFTHELDAVLNHEWRVMPFLSLLPDRHGMMVFVAMHVPLFALIVGFVACRDERTRRLARIVMSSFLLVHAGLHYWFSGSPAYEFSSVLSQVWIYGGAALGGAYLLLHYLGDTD